MPSAPRPTTSSSSSSAAGAPGTGADHSRRHSDADAFTRGKSDGGGTGGGTFSLNSAGRDVHAEAVARRRRRQGAGDAVEYVRIKHIATMRYLCVGKKCDPLLEGEKSVPHGERGGAAEGTGVGAGASAAGQQKATGSKRVGGGGGGGKEGGTPPRVGMVTVERRAAVPAATVFVVRPRTVVGASPPVVAAATDGGLGPEDLVHLQHKDTGLFLSALPLDERAPGGRVGLTVIKSPLTTEASARWSPASTGSCVEVVCRAHGETRNLSCFPRSRVLLFLLQYLCYLRRLPMVTQRIPPEDHASRSIPCFLSSRVFPAVSGRARWRCHL